MWLAFSFFSFLPFQFLATWNSSPWPWQPALGRPDPDLVPCKQRHSVTLSPAMPFVSCTRITASGCHGDAHRIWYVYCGREPNKGLTSLSGTDRAGTSTSQPSFVALKGHQRHGPPIELTFYLPTTPYYIRSAHGLFLMVLEAKR